MNDRPIRVLLVDDDPMVAAGLRTILGAAPDIEVVGEVRDGDQTLGAVRQLRPDVVLLDIRMKRQDGIATAAQLAKMPARPRVLMLTTWDTEGLVSDSVAAGADGFLLKTAAPLELQAAVRDVCAGGGVVTPSQMPELLDSLARVRREQSAASALLDRLTESERQVCIELTGGGTNAAIAKRLHLAESTVKSHLTSAQRKLGDLDRTGVIVLVTRAGLSRL